jgi:CBS domain-containing protein
MSVEQPAAGQKRVAETPEEKTDRPRHVRQHSVSQLKTDDFVCIEPTTPLSEAIERMKEDEGGCAIVCEGGRIVGIFTERDLITKVVGEEVEMNAPVSRHMTTTVETLSMEATIGDVVELMNLKGYRNIPLVKDGKLHGSISVFDVITYLAESYPKETMNLPPVPAQVMDTQEGG